nr:glutamate--cysteine ligase, chloroplastic [Quercus suber]
MQDFMAGKLLSLPGEFPTLNDWENHLTAIYPEVGLLYDEVSLQNVLEMISDWTSEERQMLRDKDGLERRSLMESVYLNELAEIFATGVTPAEKLLQMYNEKWGHNVDHVFEELRY